MVGKVFVFEGLDYSGKSSVSRYCFEQLKEEHQVESYRNPGGTILGEKVRDIARIETENVEEQLLAYFLAIVSVKNQVLRDIKAGKIVLLDRWLLSTLAYQVKMLESRTKQDAYSKLIYKHLQELPVHILFFDLSFMEMLDRIKQVKKTDTVDRFDSSDIDYKLNVFTNYQKTVLELEKSFAAELTIVKSEPSLELLQAKVLKLIEESLKK